jgi:hypothetical protein
LAVARRRTNTVTYDKDAVHDLACQCIGGLSFIAVLGGDDEIQRQLRQGRDEVARLRAEAESLKSQRQQAVAQYQALRVELEALLQRERRVVADLEAVRTQGYAEGLLYGLLDEMILLSPFLDDHELQAAVLRWCYYANGKFGWSADRASQMAGVHIRQNAPEVHERVIKDMERCQESQARAELMKLFEDWDAWAEGVEKARKELWEATTKE